MKKLLALVVAVAASSVFAAYVPVTHTWKGGDETSPYEWNVAANWVDGFVPTNAADTCVFDIGEGNSATITRTDMPAETLPSISILSGTVTFSSGMTTLPRGGANKTNAPYNPGNVTNVFFVAEGAVMKVTAKLSAGGSNYGGGANAGIRKTGKGSCTCSGGIGDSNGNGWTVCLDIVEGSFTFSGSSSYPVVKGLVYVHSGATYSTTGARSIAFTDQMLFRVDKGGKIRFSVYNGHNDVIPKGIIGDGDVVIYDGRGSNEIPNNQLNLSLLGGPYRFDGRIYSTYANPARFAILDRSNVSAEAKKFVIGAADTLSGTNGTGKLFYYPYVSPVWGRGVGEFWSFPIVGQPGVPIPTEDEDGEPITLHAGLDATGISATQVTGAGVAEVTGSGNWFAWGNTTTITGDQIKVTGTIGSDKGATLVLGDGTAEGEVDLSRYAGLVINGGVTFNNVSKQTIANAINAGGAVTINGPVEFGGDVTTAGGLKVGVETTFGGDVTAAGLTVDVPTTFGGDVTVTSGNTAFNAETTVPGTFRNPGKGTVTIGASTTFNAVEGSISGYTFNSDFTLLGGVLTSLPNWKGVTLSFYDTLVWGGYQNGINTYDTIYTTKKPGGTIVNADGNHATALVIGSGSEVRVGGASASSLPNMTVKDGGRLTILRDGWWRSNDSAPEALFDGGVIGLGSWKDQYAFTLPQADSTKATDTARTLKVKVGAKGLRIECNDSTPNGWQYMLRYADHLNVSSAVADGKDGGIAYSVPGMYRLYNNKAVTGPLSFEDGRVTICPSALDDEKRLGLGDIVLRGGWLGIEQSSVDLGLKLASTAGSVFRYSGASSLDLGALVEKLLEQTAVQTVTIGPADAAANAALVREPGGVLILGDVVGKKALGSDTGHHVFVNGGVATAADGRVLAPIIGSRNYSMGFLAYDATNGFTEYANYATDFGADKVVAIDATTNIVAGETVAADGLRLELAAAKGGIVMGEGATLQLGDGTNPALVLMNTAQEAGRSSDSAIKGGTIDFRASEGVFATPWKSHNEYDIPPSISAKISGSAGVTYVCENGSYGSRIYVSGANDYTGGTWVDRVEVYAQGASPFGPDPVHVGGASFFGGGVAFGTANATYANNFTLNGYGKKNDRTEYGYGTLAFAADNVTLTGAIDVERYARITSRYAAANAVSTIEGVISGGHLQFFWGESTGKKFVLKGHNTFTGGVEIVQAAVTLAGTNPALGTGEILIDQGVLRFENEDDIVVPNDFRGIGTIQLAGKNVAFTGNPSLEGDNTIIVDLAGTAPVLKNFPPFATIVNSAAKAATVTFDGGTPTIGADQTLTENVNIVLDGGAVLDLGGVDRTIRRLTVVDGSVVNGTITETNPKKGALLLVR